MKCPRCGSEKVQLSNVRSKHGVFYFIFFGIFWIIHTLIKWCVGITIFIFYDWWMFIIKKVQNKGYIWQSKKWFALTKKNYYCHDCGYNFK